MPVQQESRTAAMQNNPDLERLEAVLVKLGFALEQQEKLAEAQRIKYEDKIQNLLERLNRVENKLSSLLDSHEPTSSVQSAPYAAKEGQ